MHGAVLCTLVTVALIKLSPGTCFSTRALGSAPPHFLQCDPKWGTNEMGVKGKGEQATICKEGCAMTSLSMALNGLGLYINDTELDPGVLNSWLQENDGYVCDAGDCNNLVLDAPERLPGSPLSFQGEKEKPNVHALNLLANSDLDVVLLHVHDSGHFVLLQKSDGGESGIFNVLDPFFNTSVYHYDNVSDIIHYHVERSDGTMHYPTYKQCDGTWGKNAMGKNNETICQVGCLMSSIAEALFGHNILVDGKFANPMTVNQFLKTHGGYVGNTSNLDESIVPMIDPTHVKWPKDGMHVTNDLSPHEVANFLGGPNLHGPPGKHRVVIANVLHGGHFVLVQALGGKNRSSAESAVFVHDSGFPRAIYSFNEVVGWRIFDMLL